MTFLWLFWYQIIPFSNLVFFMTYQFLLLCQRPTKMASPLFIYIRKIYIRKCIMEGLISYRDLKWFFIYMYMSTIVTCAISELSETLRNRYTLVSKSVSAVDNKWNKINTFIWHCAKYVDLNRNYFIHLFFGSAFYSDRQFNFY